MKFTRIKTSKQARHAGSRSNDHKQDKAEGEARRQITFISVKTEPRPSPQRNFPGVDAVEVIADPNSERWFTCKEPDEFGDYLTLQTKLLSRFYAKTLRHGEEEWMARSDPSLLKIHTVSFHPAHSQLIADLLSIDADARHLPRQIFEKFIAAAAELFRNKRNTIGAALHVDTDDLHVDVVVSRNGPQGRIGKAGLGMVGAWCTTLDRQLRSNARISRQKRAQFDRSLANFRHREGNDAVPFDVQLARAFDAAAEEVLGAKLKPYLEQYAADVPALEEAHLKAELAQLKSACDKIEERLLQEEFNPLRNPMSAPFLSATDHEIKDHQLQYPLPFPERERQPDGRDNKS